MREHEIVDENPQRGRAGYQEVRDPGSTSATKGTGSHILCQKENSNPSHLTGPVERGKCELSEVCTIALCKQRGAGIK